MTNEKYDEKDVSVLSKAISLYNKRKLLFLLLAVIVILFILFLRTLDPQEMYWNQQAQQIEEHSQQWIAQKINKYQIEIHWLGYPEDCKQKTTVENNLIKKIIKNDCKYSDGGTIDDLFSYVKRLVQAKHCGGNGCACDGPFIMDVIYDEKYGFPKNAKPAYHHEERWRFGGGNLFSPMFCTLLGDLYVAWEVDSFLLLK